MPRQDGSIYVGRLAKSTRQKDLEEIFESYGRLLRCDIKYGSEVAYAFIDFEDRRDAEDCVKYENGREFNGQAITVEWAKGGKEKRITYDECFRCRRTGHWARDCPELRWGRRGGGGGGGGGGFGGRRRSPSPRRRRSRSRDRRRRSRSRSYNRSSKRSRSRDRRRSRSRSNERKRSRSGSDSHRSRSESVEKKKDSRYKNNSRDRKSSGSRSKSRSRSKSKSRSKTPRQQLDNTNEQVADDRFKDGSDNDNGRDDGDGRRSRSGSKD